MIKTLRIPLKLDQHKVKDLNELREHFNVHFNLDDVLTVYRDDRLRSWLKTRQFQTELSQLEAIPADSDLQQIAIALCGIFQLEVSADEINALVYPLQLQQQQQQRLELLAQQQFKRDAVITDYHAGYQQLCVDIQANRHDKLFLSAAVNSLKISYPQLLRIHFADFFQLSTRSADEIAELVLQRFNKQPFEPEMVVIKGGGFMMGSPSSEADRSSDERQHEVTVADFEIAKYPVTQAQWQAVMGSNPSSFKGDDLPVESVSWLDVQDFIEKLNQMTGQRYRLPTEAEWEYACRAGTSTPFYTGSSVNSSQANYNSNLGKTTPVGSYPANLWDLYDMMGNVWEWTASIYVENYDGSESKSSSNNNAKTLRVVRGGSWVIKPGGLRSADRYGNSPGDRFNYIGLRLSRM